MKQRVLIANKFYYPRGGDCVCTLNLERLLADKGHEVAVYSMTYPENLPSAWSGYFASPVDFGGGAKEKLRAAARTMGWGDVRGSFARILSDFRPDVVHLQNIHSYLSPQLAVMAREAGARVVWTLHDFKPVCPSYGCLREGRPCEECFGSKIPVLRHRCMKGSLAASFIAWLEALRWNRRALERVVDTFVCPSAFMAAKMAQAGFSKSRLMVNCNFVGFDKMEKFRSLEAPDAAGRGDYYCYVGRLSEEKGVESLLDAASRLPHALRIAGDGPLLESLRGRYAGRGNIHFLGRQNPAEIVELLRGARFSVMPSICYENNPLGVIESLCAGTPVVGAGIGGIPELIDAGNTGLTFESGNPEALAKAIENAFGASWDYRSIRGGALARFSADRHYDILMDAYSK
ncbi:MAG: glycosyltransferase [Muribaculaceae bacterium]|nr:glycosyltransferase [Muribaculaceae bacterium]